MTKDDALIRFRNILMFRNLSQNTVYMYCWFISIFLDRHPIGGRSNPLGLDEALEFIIYLRDEKNYKGSSLNIAICAVRYFYETVLNTVFSRRQFPNIIYEQKGFYVFSDQQILTLCAHADRRMLAWIWLGFDCGLRSSEVCNLHVSDIDSKNMLIFIRPSKNRKSRYVKLSKACLNALRLYWMQYHPEGEYVFPGRKKPALHVNSLRRTFRSYVEEIGLYEEGVRFHSLRHTFATRMLEKGCDIFLLKKLMGHSSLASTAVYVHKTTKDIQSSFSLSDFMELPE